VVGSNAECDESMHDVIAVNAVRVCICLPVLERYKSEYALQNFPRQVLKPHPAYDNSDVCCGTTSDQRSSANYRAVAFTLV
jgi:hypothetical protein